MDFNRREKQPLAILFGSFIDQCSKDQEEEQNQSTSSKNEMRKGTEKEFGNWPDLRVNKQSCTRMAPLKRKRKPSIEIGNFLLGLEAQQTSLMGLASLEAVPVTPKAEVDEIDLPDVNNVLSEELYVFYSEQQHVQRPRDYMHFQIMIDAKMRENLVCFLTEVHQELQLQPETLYLAVSIVDRFLSLYQVTCCQLRIVGISSLFIATKYEEDWVPKVYKFLTVSGGEYSKKDVCIWEKVILDTLEWYLTVPTTYMFLLHFVKAAKADEELENMISYYGSLGLTQYSLVLYCPSMVAAATVYAARCTLEMYPLWTDTLQRHTSYSESQLVDCAEIIIQAHLASIYG